MQISDACLSWLSSTLAIEMITEAWVFGSAVHPEGGYNDVDVFVRYRDGCARRIAHLRRSVAVDFKDQFGVPVHLLALSEMESEQSSEFLRKALCGGIRIV